jgi:predicted enzyme related to lactoylglutathione lyase
MTKNVFLVMLAVAASFLLGVAFHSVMTADPSGTPGFKRVTGIGGIFFKAKEPKKVREWYRAHLGLHTNQYGAVFEWRQGSDSSKKGFLQWSVFKDQTTYFEPSTKEFMINYRVENLTALVESLKAEGVTVTDTIESAEYGKFVHIMDIEGNKIELWEPNDVVFEELGVKLGATTTK